ncbi:hypothetical protein F4805DRAFT_436001 [Annulohypoxylon moriforme]|nr:hypothetical protein F4805DRAFT_436001 [Annulohypoxylon moriforme]
MPYPANQLSKHTIRTVNEIFNMRLICTLLLSLLSIAGAVPLSSSRMIFLVYEEIVCLTNKITFVDVTSPDAVDFSTVGDEYKRSIQSPDAVDFDAVGDEYKRNIQSPEDVNFDAVGDEY